jgi:hypothetical protein
MNPNVGRATLKFDGLPGAHEVPAEVLIRTLQGFQSSVWKLAAAGSDRVVQHRFRPTEAIKSEFQVRCVATPPGSFLLKVVVGTVIGIAPVDEIVSNEAPTVTPAAVLDQYTDFMSALSRRDERGMIEAVPDTRWRELLVKDCLKYLPEPDDDWWIDLSHDDALANKSVRLDRRVRAVARDILERGEEDVEDEMTFTARLDSVDFQRQSVKLFFVPTGKSLQCPYQFDEEDNLVASRRRLVEVRAKCIPDEFGYPAEVVEVRSIHPHDLSPLTISFIVEGSREFAIEPPLTLDPTQDDESKGQLLSVVNNLFGFDCCAASRSELEREVERTLLFLWDNYATEQDENMTEDAIRVAKVIRERMKPRGL